MSEGHVCENTIFWLCVTPDPDQKGMKGLNGFIRSFENCSNEVK